MFESVCRAPLVTLSLSTFKVCDRMEIEQLERFAGPRASEMATRDNNERNPLLKNDLANS